MTLELAVEGMSCGDCEAAVVSALDEVDGVESATADHETDHVTVEGDPDPLDAIVAVEDAGYEADTA
jgi:copper chaperone CopZ